MPEIKHREKAAGEDVWLTDGTAGCFPGGVGEVGEVLGFTPPAFFFRRIVDEGIDVMASMKPELS